MNIQYHNRCESKKSNRDTSRKNSNVRGIIVNNPGSICHLHLSSVDKSLNLANASVFTSKNNIKKSRNSKVLGYGSSSMSFCKFYKFTLND